MMVEGVPGRGFSDLKFKNNKSWFIFTELKFLGTIVLFEKIKMNYIRHIILIWNNSQVYMSFTEMEIGSSFKSRSSFWESSNNFEFCEITIKSTNSVDIHNQSQTYPQKKKIQSIEKRPTYFLSSKFNRKFLCTLLSISATDVELQKMHLESNKRNDAQFFRNKNTRNSSQRWKFVKFFSYIYNWAFLVPFLGQNYQFCNI